MNNNWPFKKLAQKAIKNLKDKEQDILISYFGVEKDTHTLESIGKRYKITRERVRQIKNNALVKMLKNAEKSYQNMLSDVNGLIKNLGGIASEELLTDKFLQGRTADRNAFILALFTNENIALAKETDCHKKLWVYNGHTAQLIAPACDTFIKVLQKNKEPMKLNDLIAEFKKTAFYKKNGAKLSNSLLKSIPFSSKIIIETEKGEWGLKTWPTINPRNTRDKIYFILKEAEKPLHFRELTKRIAGKSFEGKKPASATVHNELIADKRFVLIGKGIYALTEWGYRPGTVAQVLKEILKKVKKGLAQEDLIAEVLKVRQIAKNTVVMNLRSQKSFAFDEAKNVWKLTR